MPRRLLLLWSTISSWPPTWLTESLCLREFHQFQPLPTSEYPFRCPPWRNTEKPQSVFPTELMNRINEQNRVYSRVVVVCTKSVMVMIDLTEVDISSCRDRYDCMDAITLGAEPAICHQLSLFTQWEEPCHGHIFDKSMLAKNHGTIVAPMSQAEPLFIGGQDGGGPLYLRLGSVFMFPFCIVISLSSQATNLVGWHEQVLGILGYHLQTWPHQF